MSLLLLFGGGTGPAAPATVTTTTATTAGGVGRAAWRDYSRKSLPKKKKKLVDELDDILLELRSRIEDVEPEYVEPEWVKEFRKQEAFANSDLVVEATLDDLKARLMMVREIVREMDDEEAILLAIH